MAFSPQPLTGISAHADEPSDAAALRESATTPRVRIVLTQAARAHVLQNGLSKKVALLVERADTLATILLQGDRIGLSEAANHDLYVLRRRLLVELSGNVLEIILEVPGPRG